MTRATEPCPPPPEGWRQRAAAARVVASDIGDDGTWPMPEGSGPCRTWPLEPGCGCLAPGDTEQPWGGAATWTPEQQHAVEVATEMLWRLTAGRFGLCKEIIRPCRCCTCSGCGGGPPRPELHGGQWRNASCGSCGCWLSDCSCPAIPEIDLPGPVYWEPLLGPPDWRCQYRPHPKTPDPQNSTRYRLIVWQNGKTLLEPGWPEEWVPGEPLPPDWTPSHGQYWLNGHNRLVRIDGGTWPDCQNIAAAIQPSKSAPHVADGTFAIQYWRGTPVPPGGRRAVSILACELWKACGGGSGECRLPQHVQSITREGVQYQMVDTTNYTADGRTGLADVDSWIAAVNPHALRSPPGVWSPDLPSFVTTWTSGDRSGGGNCP